MNLGPYLLGPNDTPENGIYTGDARELAKAIPDESIDLIFTDPVYDRIDDYRWLAETGARVLKMDGACLAWCGIGYLPLVVLRMSHALVYRWMLTSVRQGPGAGRFVGGYSCRKSICLVFNGKPKANGLWDVSFNGRSFMARQVERDGIFKWAKHVDTLLRWTEGMSNIGATIFDPFTGGGTVPAVCKMLSRKYLAFEIDPDVAQMARDRVRHTQPPLPIEMPTQEVLL